MPVPEDVRSQPILRLPKDQTPAVITMQDGEQSNVFLFVAPGGSIARVLGEPEPFLPINFSTGTRLVARSSIASLRVHEIHAGIDDDGLPTERQRTMIRLRGGAIVKGELRWIAPPGRRRMLDCLNDSAPLLLAYENDYVTFVSKAHITSVEEV